MLLVTGLMYTLALRPRVVADGAGLTVVNPFRVHRIPWRLITSVDTAEWVRVRYRAGADDKILHCWALYVSGRARRKIARGPSRPRRRLLAGGFGAPVAENSRLPEEARHLASLPMARPSRPGWTPAPAGSGPGPAVPPGGRPGLSVLADEDARPQPQHTAARPMPAPGGVSPPRS